MLSQGTREPEVAGTWAASSLGSRGQETTRTFSGLTLCPEGRAQSRRSEDLCAWGP